MRRLTERSLRGVPGRACLAMVAVALVAPRTAWSQEPPTPDQAVTLLTAAEKTEYQATSRYADVMDFCRQLAQQSPLVALTEYGTSVEGRSLPLLILAEPRVETPEQARSSGKLVVLAMGNIHAGEVCGKEALLMLVRELATAADRALLNDIVLLVAPIVNADGNERVSVENRPDQAGPPQGVGIRANAQGLDLNRDFVKLDTPEVRALVRLVNRWDPAVLFDCHTTNGSYHRYTLTYDSPRHPATQGEIIRFTRDDFLPEVSRRLERQSGIKTFFYGNFAADHTRWETFPALPRVGIQYFGTRNRIAILSEAYAYAPFRDRVLATRGFVQACLQLCAEQRPKIEDLIRTAGKATSGRVEQPESATVVPLRSETAVLGKFSIAGYVETQQDGHTVATPEPRDYEVEYLGVEQATVSARRPEGYLIPAACQAAVDILHRHGIAVQQLREDIELDVEVYSIREIRREERPYEGHVLATLETDSQAVPQRFPAGTYLVRTDQPLGTLAMLLLEPQSSDGLAVWSCVGSEFNAGQDFPIVRLPRWSPILTASKPAPEAAPREKKPLTYDAVFGDRPVDFGGSPASGLRWLDDGEHFLQFKEAQLWKVHALTGRCAVFYEKEPVKRALEAVEGLDGRAAERLAEQARQRFNPRAKAALLEYQNDLYYVTLSGERALRLTDSPAPEELAEFSPDGQRVAFVRQNDLFVVDVRSGKERQLTAGGSEVLRRGKTDWVYFEEVNDRSWKAYRWSPDSQSLAFLEFNDERVVPFAVVDHLAIQQQVETERFPLAGQPNPLVRLGVVRAAGGDVRWLDLARYSPDNMLITNFGWFPNSQEVFSCVQDRTQRWLDFNRGRTADGATSTLFREQTEAWVDNPGDPTFLKDGSFLLPSERDGWKHLYLFSPDGSLVRRVTEGEWEVRQVLAVDEPRGWALFSGTKDSHLAENVYRVKLDGTELTRLTAAAGSHRAAVNASGALFIDSWSDFRTPTRVQLCDPNGATVRTLDTNPVPTLDAYELSAVELVQIPLRDGFVLEASLIKPPAFDSQKKYPVWLSTYGGPHMPTLSDAWQGGRTFEQLLAQMGIIAFRCDPRSASGKGARSTWQAYRQLGVRELSDLEEALDWLAKQPYVDASRIGISGHSYGGFLTAFALTHSQRFAAGIAGAPVTDWRNYDSIYTERYMSTPQDNAEGYEKSSVVAAAKNLHGRLLLLHGARDDNVHLANTLQLAHALQEADKTFEMMIYPPYRHGIYGAHYRRLMIDFIRRTMLEP